MEVFHLLNALLIFYVIFKVKTRKQAFVGEIRMINNIYFECVYMCVLGSSSGASHFVFRDRGDRISHWPGAHQVSGLTGQQAPGRSTSLQLSSTGIASPHHHMQLFYTGSGVELRSSCSCDRYFTYGAIVPAQ